MDSNSPISRPISSRSTPNVYISSQSLTVQIPADVEPTPETSQPSQSSQQQDLDNRMLAARLGLKRCYSSIFPPGSHTSAKYWIKDSYASVNVSPFNEPLTSNLDYQTMKAMVEHRYKHHSAFFKQLALEFYRNPRQSTYLLYGEFRTSVDPTTYKLVHYTHGNHCIIRFHTGLWYEGNVVNNKYTGQGIMTYPNGNFYKGEWLNSKKHGQGSYVEYRTDKRIVKLFEGKFVDDKLIEGTLTQRGKTSVSTTVTDVYVGEFKDLYPHGKGKLTFDNGATYEGDWDMGKRHGKGIYKNITYTPPCSCDKQCSKCQPTKVTMIYEGQWVNDHQTGVGTIKVINYDTQELSFMYKGSMNGNVKSGIGSGVHIGGLVIEGEYKDNLANGKCKMLHTKRGWFYEGEVRNGKRHGTGTMYAADGSVIQGVYHQNVLTGHARIVHDGNVFEGMLVNDKAEGMGKHSYANGWVFEGEFKAGVRSKGLLKLNDSDWYCGEFVGGKFHGQGTFSNQEGVYVGTFENGQPHGQGTFTFVDGTVVNGEFNQGFNLEVSARANRLIKVRRQTEPVLHRIQEQNIIAKPKDVVKKRGVANLKAKTRRLMKQFKVPDNVQLVEQLIHRLPKGVKMTDVATVVRAAMKLIKKQNE